MNGLIYDAINAIVERKLLQRLRHDLLAPLCGTVVEVGAGTGTNFPHYPSGVHVLALEPDPAMLARAPAKVKRSRATIDLRVADDAALDQLDPQSADAVVWPLVLCTVDDPRRALQRARRVLRPDGRLVVLEHVRGDGLIGQLQDAILPVWRRIAGGCRPNQDTRRLLHEAGFDTSALQQHHLSNISPIQDLLVGYAAALPSAA
jgi:ubiquinone/menaquinone biosynthesis C-methylase UbiE